MSYTHHTTPHRTSNPNRSSDPGESNVFGIVVFVALALIGLVSMVQKFQKRQRVEVDLGQASGLLQKAYATDNRWRPDLVRKRLEAIFPPIQKALRTGDPCIAAAFMSPRGQHGLHGRLETLAHQGYRYEIEQPRLRTARALFVVDKSGDAGDILWMEITGTRVCYEASLADGCLREGSHKENRKFTELWKLVHGPEGQWLVDEIVPPTAVDRMMPTLQAMYKARA